MVWKQMAFNQFKVKLRSQVTKVVVAFDVTPEITETRNVNYKTLEPVHMPGGIHVYGNTSSRVFNINNIRLVSRTREEASKNLYRLNIMRGWAMPYFGVNNTSLVGAPPDVLSLSAYSTGPRDTANDPAASGDTDEVRRANVARLSKTGPDANKNTTNLLKRERPTNLNNIPVVMQQISIPYPSDTDYISTMEKTFGGTTIKEGVPFPTIMTVDVVLLETHSPLEFTTFNLTDYRQGLLDNF